MTKGMIHLTHAMECCHCQHRARRFFAFEHPYNASSWEQDVVKNVARLPGVETVIFDQCMLGLVSPVRRIPIRKRTKIMTNNHVLAAALRGIKCDRSHAHQRVEGAEGGVRMSLHAQKYPEALCRIIARAVMAS